jgi:plasmid stabilization system protein ParE
MPPDTLMPSDWNESVITELLRDTRPDVIPHVIEQLKRRFVIHSADRTAKARLDFLTRVLQELNLRKQCTQVVQDLEVMSREREIRLKKLGLQVLETERDHEKVKGEIQVQATLHELELQRDVAKVKREIAEIEAETARIMNPPKSGVLAPRSPSVEEQIAAQEAKIARYRHESADRQQNAGSPPEAQRWKVFYEDLINDAQEELKKLLRRR